MKMKLAITALVIGILLVVFPIRLDKSAAELEKKYATGGSQFIDIDGQRVHFRDEGRGHPIILIHGTSSSLHTWDGWADYLKDNYRVIRMDLPGFGLTGPRPDEDYSISSYVQFLKDFTTKLELSNFTMAGNSLGGGLTWEYAVDYPGDVSYIALLNAGGYPKDNVSILIKMGTWPIVGDLMPLITPKWVVQMQVENVYGDVNRLQDGIVDRYYDLLLREGNRKAFQKYTRQLVRTVSRHDEIKTITQPTLIIWGELDRLIPKEDAFKFGNEIANASIRMYKGVGHVPMEEIPEQSANDLDDFLQKHLVVNTKTTSDSTALAEDIDN